MAASSLDFLLTSDVAIDQIAVTISRDGLKKDVRLFSTDGRKIIKNRPFAVPDGVSLKVGVELIVKSFATSTWTFTITDSNTKQELFKASGKTDETGSIISLRDDTFAL